ncbi:2785_t:CDS:2, partial [Dentiscutata erythropus]
MPNDNISELTEYPSSIVTMWVLLEGKASAVEVDVDQKNYMTRNFNLDRLKPILKEEFSELQDVARSEIEIFTYNDRTNPLPPDTNLSLLSEKVTGTSPLVIRYPLSTSNVIVRCNLSTSWFKSSFPHTSGLWYLVRNIAKSKFQTLRLETVQFSFIHNENNGKQQIENEFQFNKMISKIKPNCEDEREVSISIQVTGRKAYGDWEIGEALNEFLHQKGSTMFDIRSFSIGDLPRPNPPIPEEAIAQLIAELKKRKSAFGIVNRNESTCRDHPYPRRSKGLLLKAEEWIDGTKAYGPIDYSIFIEEVLVLVQEVKKDDFEKGTAQNIAQIHSAVESRKRRIKIDPGDEEVPVVMYGIVTNALQWYFLRWAGSSDDPTVELSGPLTCEFNSNSLEQVKIILSCIASILQYQVRGYDDDSKRTLAQDFIQEVSSGFTDKEIIEVVDILTTNTTIEVELAYLFLKKRFEMGVQELMDIIKHLSGLTLETLRKRTQRSIKLYKLIKKIGVDKIKNIKTFSEKVRPKVPLEQNGVVNHISNTDSTNIISRADMTKKTSPIAQASAPSIFEPEVDVSISPVSVNSKTKISVGSTSKTGKKALSKKTLSEKQNNSAYT